MQTRPQKNCELDEKTKSAVTASYQTFEIETDADVDFAVDGAILGAEEGVVAIEPSETAVEDLDAVATDLRHRQDENGTSTVMTETATCPKAVVVAGKSLDVAALPPVQPVPTQKTLYLAPDHPAFDHPPHHATAPEDVDHHLVTGAQRSESVQRGEEETIELVEMIGGEIVFQQVASAGLTVADRAPRRQNGAGIQTQLVAQDLRHVEIETLGDLVAPRRHRIPGHAVVARDDSQFVSLSVAALQPIGVGD